MIVTQYGRATSTRCLVRCEQRRWIKFEMAKRIARDIVGRADFANMARFSQQQTANFMLAGSRQGHDLFHYRP